MSELEIALKAVEIYASTHPRPPHVTQRQAAAMLGVSAPTVCAMVKRKKLKLNEFGMIPITEIDRAIKAA